VVICLERGADLHMSQLMPLPLTVSCFSEIQIGFTFLVPAHPGSPGKRAIKWVCVCVCLEAVVWSSGKASGPVKIEWSGEVGSRSNHLYAKSPTGQLADNKVERVIINSPSSCVTSIMGVGFCNMM